MKYQSNFIEPNGSALNPEIESIDVNMESHRAAIRAAINLDPIEELEPRTAPSVDGGETVLPL